MRTKMPVHAAPQSCPAGQPAGWNMFRSVIHRTATLVRADVGKKASGKEAFLSDSKRFAQTNDRITF